MNVELNRQNYDVKLDLDFVAEARVDNENSSTKFARLVRKLRIGELARVHQYGQVAIWKRIDARKNEGSALKNVASLVWG